MPVQFDDSRYPILVVHFQPEVTDDDVARQDRFVYPRFERMLREQRMGVLLVNNDPGATLSASQRKAIAAGNQRHAELLRRACLGIGSVIHSPLQRGVLTALMWVIQTPVPITSFASFVEADHWARRQIANERPIVDRSP